MVAFTAVKLGALVEPNDRAGMVLHLEPHGDLFAEVGKTSCAKNMKSFPFKSEIGLF